MREFKKKYYRSTWIGTAYEVQKWSTEHNAYPRTKAEDPYERFLGTRLRDMRIRLIKKYEGIELDDIENPRDREIVSIIRDLDKNYYGKNKPSGRPATTMKKKKRRLKEDSYELSNNNEGLASLYYKGALEDAFKLKDWVIKNNKVPANYNTSEEEKKMYDIMSKLAHTSRYIMIERLAGELANDPLYDKISDIVFNIKSIAELAEKENEQKRLTAKRDAAKDLCESAKHALENERNQKE